MPQNVRFTRPDTRKNGKSDVKFRFIASGKAVCMRTEQDYKVSGIRKARIAKQNQRSYVTTYLTEEKRERWSSISIEIVSVHKISQVKSYNIAGGPQHSSRNQPRDTVRR